MAGEQEAIAASPDGATDTTSPTSEATDESRKVEDQTGDDTAEGEEETPEAGAGELEDELEEFDWNGRKVKGPKGLKDGVLMQADYTRKTQELSKDREAVAAERQRLTDQAKVAEEDLKMRGQLYAKQAELEEYRKIDWDAWAQSDPVQAQQAFMRYQRLNGEVTELNAEVGKRAQQRTSEAQRDLAKRLEETQDYARKNIKGWTPETDRQIVDFAKEQGVDLPTLQSVMSPTIYRILHRAMLGEQLLKSQATKPAPKPVPIVPLETVGAKANQPARKSLADMNMDEYVAARKKQIAARG